MSALMPETNRKNCVDPTVFPMRRQNTSNQTPANASTSAAQLTASPGPYTACSWPLCQLRRSCQNPAPRQSANLRLTSPWEKIYKIGSTLSSLMSRTIRKTLKPPLLVPLPEKTQATRQCKHKQTKLGIQLGGITSRKLNAELHKSP